VKHSGAVTFLLSFFLALFGSTEAQTNPNLEIGLKPFGSYDTSGFDSVSVTNGNLTMHIPLFSVPQRGDFTSPTYITYNAKGWLTLPETPLKVSDSRPS